MDRADPDCPPEALRPLTADGRGKTAQAAAGMRRMKVRPDVVLTSPLRRAIETAQIVVEQLGLPPEVLRQTPALQPGAPVLELLAELRHENAASIMIVGHEPDLSGFASWLLVGSAEALELQLKKPALCILEIDEVVSPRPAAHLIALLQPAHLRKQAR